MFGIIVIGAALTIGAFNHKPIQKFDHKVVHSIKAIGHWFKTQ